jgi:hypothetical protein
MNLAGSVEAHMGEANVKAAPAAGRSRFGLPLFLVALFLIE